MNKGANTSGLNFWERYASVYDIFMAKDRRAYDVLGKEIGTELTPEMQVLELACGTGLVSARIAPACKQLTAIDYSQKMICEARRKVCFSNLVFEQADIYHLPYSSQSFDCVVISNGLHILPDPVSALRCIHRALKDGGVLIAPTFMHDDSPGNQVLRKPMEWLGFSSYSLWAPDEYKKFFTDNGWQIKRSVTISASFPINLVVAIKNY